MFYFSLQTRHDPSIGAFTRSNSSQTSPSQVEEKFEGTKVP